MTLQALRESRDLHERRRVRANDKYKAAKKGSASAIFWLARRKYEWRWVQRRDKEIRKKIQSNPRSRVVAVAEMCARNYRRNPAAYHYLAGGRPNTVIDRPTPWSWRSDCSQFAANVYRMAGLKCPGTGTFLHSNTGSIAARGQIVRRPQPGDFKMWCYDPRRPRSTTHHMEVCTDSHGTTIGHGTRAVDSLAPGGYFYYLRFLP